MNSHNGINFKIIYNNVINNLLKSIVPIIIFEIIYNISLILLINPLLKGFIKILLKISGSPILINEEIIKFIFSLFGFFSIILIIFLVMLVIFYEFSVILIMIKKGMNNEEIIIIDTMKEGIKKLNIIKSFSHIRLGVYLIVIIPLLGIGLNSSLIPQIIIPNFILNEVIKHSGGYILIGLLTLIGLVLFTRILFVLPIITFEEVNYSKAKKISKSITGGSTIRFMLYIFITLLIWLIIGILPLLILSKFKGIIFDLLFIIFSIIYFFISISVTPLILTLITLLYEKYRQNKEIKIIEKIKITEFLNKIKQDFRVYIKKIIIYFKNKKLLIVLFFILVILNIFNIFSEEINYSYLEKPIVIGHRGSLVGVENTVESVLNGEKEGAEYAEIDVLLSKDNIPVVVHDNNLKRLTGNSNKISNMSAEEIKEVKLNSRGYTGEILRLDEFFDQVSENINLLIEIKTHGREKESIVQKTMESLEGRKLENTIFQTTDYNILREMKEKYPNKKIGYIIIGNIGWFTSDIVKKIPADFLVFEESIIRESLISNVHKAGKPVFVWTVNDKESAKELYELGVDGIITDYPRKISEVRDKLLEVND